MSTTKDDMDGNKRRPLPLNPKQLQEKDRQMVLAGGKSLNERKKEINIPLGKDKVIPNKQLSPEQLAELTILSQHLAKEKDAGAQVNIIRLAIKRNSVTYAARALSDLIDLNKDRHEIALFAKEALDKIDPNRARVQEEFIPIAARAVKAPSAISNLANVLLGGENIISSKTPATANKTTPIKRRIPLIPLNSKQKEVLGQLRGKLEKMGAASEADSVQELININSLKASEATLKVLSESVKERKAAKLFFEAVKDGFDYEKTYQFKPATSKYSPREVLAALKQISNNISKSIHQARVRMEESNPLSLMRQKALGDLHDALGYFKGNEVIDGIRANVNRIIKEDNFKMANEYLKGALKQVPNQAGLVLAAIDKFDPKFRDSDQNPYRLDPGPNKARVALSKVGDKVAQKVQSVKDRVTGNAETRETDEAVASMKVTATPKGKSVGVAHELLMKFHPPKVRVEAGLEITSEQRNALKDLREKLKDNSKLNEHIGGLLKGDRPYAENGLKQLLQNMYIGNIDSGPKEVLAAIDKFDPMFRHGEKNPYRMDNVMKDLMSELKDKNGSGFLIESINLNEKQEHVKGKPGQMAYVLRDIVDNNSHPVFKPELLKAAKKLDACVAPEVEVRNTKKF